MEDKEYKKQIEALKKKGYDPTKKPIYAVDVYNYRAERLVAEALPHREGLKSINFDWNLYLDLPLRIKVLRRAESEWNAYKTERSETQKKWDTDKKSIKMFRNDLIDSFIYAVGEDEKQLKAIREISKGNSLSDLVQDLADLHVRGNIIKEQLESINFDLNQLDKASQLSNELGALLGKAAVTSSKYKEVRINRNLAFTDLRKAVDALVKAGKHVYKRDAAAYRVYILGLSNARSTNNVNTSDDSNEEVA